MAKQILTESASSSTFSSSFATDHSHKSSESNQPSATTSPIITTAQFQGEEIIKIVAKGHHSKGHIWQLICTPIMASQTLKKFSYHTYRCLICQTSFIHHFYHYPNILDAMNSEKVSPTCEPHSRRPSNSTTAKITTIPTTTKVDDDSKTSSRSADTTIQTCHGDIVGDKTRPYHSGSCTDFILKLLEIPMTPEDIKREKRRQNNPFDSSLGEAQLKHHFVDLDTKDPEKLDYHTSKADDVIWIYLENPDPDTHDDHDEWANVCQVELLQTTSDGKFSLVRDFHGVSHIIPQRLIQAYDLVGESNDDDDDPNDEDDDDTFVSKNL
jgi:hypothetical protein